MKTGGKVKGKKCMCCIYSIVKNHIQSSLNKYVNFVLISFVNFYVNLNGAINLNVGDFKYVNTFDC